MTNGTEPTTATDTPRTHTPDQRITHTGGDVATRVRLKRACNGCGAILGDLDDRDVDEHGELVDVRAECPVCRPLLELERAGRRGGRLMPAETNPARKPSIRRGDPLTTRERQVLDGMARALSNGAIAAELFLSVHTVGTHARTLFAKLGVHARAEAVVAGYRCGVLGRVCPTCQRSRPAVRR